MHKVPHYGTYVRWVFFQSFRSREFQPFTHTLNCGQLCFNFHLPISTCILEDDQERRSFSFFCRHTFPQLSGPFDWSDFWQRLLQATHREPAIRHAVVALGALHERFEILPHTNLNFTLSKREDHNVFAMQQYSKAIKALLGSNGGQEKAADVALVTCVFFVYYETLRGHHAMAISHIHGGIKILSAFH
jgi:hypothetical protein